MAVSRIPIALKEWLHRSGLRKARGTDALLVDGRSLQSEYDPRPGDRIYHYTTAEAAESIIDSGKLWFSESSKMNDVSEYVFGEKRFKEVVDRIGGEFSRESVQVYFESLERHNNTAEMLICSFTQERDDLTQWERYANHSMGVVLGFNAYWYVKNRGVRMKRCVYNQEYLEQLVEANLFILDSAKSKRTLDNRISMSILGNLFVCDQYCFKDPRFSSEREVRLMRSVPINGNAEFGLEDMSAVDLLPVRQQPPLLQKFEIKERDGPYGRTRYLELPFVHKGWSALRSVGFGPRCPEATERRIRERFSSLKSVEFWRSDLPLR